MPGSVFHVLTSPVADVTGTVTVFDASGGTKTEAASNIVRPSDWNSSHAVTFAAAGSEISGAFSNTPGGVTFGLETNGYITAGAPAGGGGITAINVSAGTLSQNMSALTFNNGGGVTFGLAASVVTASVETNYQAPGAYLTTAMASNRGSDFIGTNTALTANGVSMTANSSGLSLNFPAFLTTAQPPGAYLTTARASNDAVGLNTALTAGPLAWTVNSSGISLNAGSAAGTTSGFGGNLISGSMTHNTAGLNLSLNHPAWLTTAAQSNHSHGNPQLNLTNLSGTTASNSAGFTLSLSAGNYLTTAAASDHSHGNPTLALTNLSGTTASNSAGFTLSLSAGAGGAGDGGNILAAGTRTAGTNSSVLFDNANGITFGLNAVGGSVMTASHNALTTARASNDALGLNTAATNVTWTANSAGVSLNAAGYAGTGTTFAGANISGSLTQNSAGINMSLSVAAPGAAAENNWFALTGNTVGNTTASGSTIALSGGNNITLSGTNGSVIRIDAPASSSLVGVDPISISTAGSTISILHNADTYPYWNPQDGYVQVAGQQGNASMHIQPARAPNVTFDRIAIPVVLSNSSNSTGTVTVSFQMGIYTRNASTLSLMSSTSATQAFTYSGTVNNSTYAGMRLLTIPWSSSLAEGQYYVGIHSRTTTGGTNASFSQYLASQVNSVFSGIIGAASNSSIQYTRGLGHYSATFSTAVPNSVAFSQIQGSQSIALRQPVFYFVNGTF